MTNQLSTQTQVSTFNFDNHAIRTITINNEPWFLSIDICNALNIANSRDAINKLDEDEYQTLSLKDTVGLTDSIANQVQSVGVVSESGMYTLILRCRDAVKKRLCTTPIQKMGNRRSITCHSQNRQLFAKRKPNPTACRRTPKPTGASLSFSLPGKRLTHQSATNLYRYRYRSPLW